MVGLAGARDVDECILRIARKTFGSMYLLQMGQVWIRSLTMTEERDNETIHYRDFGPKPDKPTLDWLLLARNVEVKFDRKTEDRLPNLIGVANGVNYTGPGPNSVDLVVRFRVLGLEPDQEYRLAVLQMSGEDDTGKGEDISSASVTPEDGLPRADERGTL